MPSTYTTNLGIEKIETGEQSGTWGTTTNTNLDLIDEAINGVEQVTLSVTGSSGSPNDLAITNATSSDGRNKFIEFIDGGDLGGTAFVQLTPNDAEKVVFIRNSLSAARDITIFQGTYNASNDFVIPNGADVVLKFDGAGAGAVVSDVYVNLTPTKLTTADLVATTADINGGSVDGATLGTNSAITEAQIDNINIDGNAITSTDTNGNIALTPDGTGEVDISKVDIDSGTIDGVTIGGASAGAGTFTTITGSGDMAIDTDTLFVDVSENRVGIGTTSPGTLLELASSSPVIRFTDTDNSAYAHVSMGSFGGLSFNADVGDTRPSTDITFLVDNTERMSLNSDGSCQWTPDGTNADMTLDASGNLLVGGTSAFGADTITLSTGGFAGIRNTSGSCLELRRDSTDGSILDFQKDGATVGSIGADGSAPYFATSVGSTLVGIKMQGGSAPRIVPTDGIGDATDNVANIGSATERFKDLYLSGGVVGNGNDIYFKPDGTNQDVTIKADGKVGIGTTDPSTALEIAGPFGGAGGLTLTQNQGNGNGGRGPSLDFKIAQSEDGSNLVTGGRIATLKDDGSAASGAASMVFSTSTSTPTLTERMKIDSSGNVGIGTSSPASGFHVFDGTSVNSPQNANRKATVIIEAGSEGSADLQFLNASYNHIFFGDAADANIGYQVYDHTNNSMQFAVNASEAMRLNSDGSCRWTPDGTNADMTLDASGNLLVGKTTVDNTNVGIVLYGQSAGKGAGSFVRDGGASLIVNRLTNDGDMISLNKDGVPVGSIASVAAGMAFYATGVNNCGWHLADNSAMLPMKNSALSDNLVDLGSVSYRFDDIYATNGTIQTSDRNEKQDIETLSEAEQRVAVACKGLLRKFRWKDAVAEKGDDARIHFGIIAQDLQAAFEAEGLDAGRYAMFIHSTWTDEETGEERSRMGVRYSELLAFIIAAI